jgi:hypothetical protein
MTTRVKVIEVNFNHIFLFIIYLLKNEYYLIGTLDTNLLMQVLCWLVFLSQQISINHLSTSSIFLSQQISTSHPPQPAEEGVI